MTWDLPLQEQLKAKEITLVHFTPRNDGFFLTFEHRSTESIITYYRMEKSALLVCLYQTNASIHLLTIIDAISLYFESYAKEHTATIFSLRDNSSNQIKAVCQHLENSGFVAFDYHETRIINTYFADTQWFISEKDRLKILNAHSVYESFAFFHAIEETLSSFEKQVPTFSFMFPPKVDHISFYLDGIQSNLFFDYIKPGYFRVTDLQSEKSTEGAIDQIKPLVFSFLQNLRNSKRIDNLFNPPIYYFTKFIDGLRIEKRVSDYIFHTFKHLHPKKDVDSLFAEPVKAKWHEEKKGFYLYQVHGNTFYLLDIHQTYFVWSKNTLTHFHEKKKAFSHFQTLIQTHVSSDIDRLLEEFL